MPSDQQLELEFWAETAEFDNTELHEVSSIISLCGSTTEIFLDCCTNIIYEIS